MGRKKTKQRWPGLDVHLPKPWKAPNKCIFCRIEARNTPEKQLTEEHVFSKWTHKFLPRTMTKYRALHATTHADRTDFVFAKKSGDILDSQAKCVCRKCNNGWMSKKIDEAAKHVMLPLIQGQQTRISPDDQRIVATWAALKAMVAEFADGESVTTHWRQRDRMMRLQLPPERGWSVWIAHYIRGNWPAYWKSTPFLVLPTHQAAIRPDRRATYYNSQASLQVVGQLFIQVIRTPMPDFAERRWKFKPPRRQATFRIWPPTGSSVVWPSGTISDQTADDLANAIHQFLLGIKGMSL